MPIHRDSLATIQRDFYLALRSQDDSQFCATVRPIASLSPRECVGIYRRAYRARLTEVLGETFESCWWVLGDKLFLEVASDYVDKVSSQDFDLDPYGKKFPQHLHSHLINIGVSEEYGFLKTLAKFEWNFKTIFHKKNPSTLQLNWSTILNESDQPVQIRLCESACLISSDKNIYEIWKLRKEPQRALDDILIEQANRLLIYKQNFRVFVRALSEKEYFVIQHLDSHGNLLLTLHSLAESFPDLTSIEVQNIFSRIKDLPVFELAGTNKGNRHTT